MLVDKNIDKHKENQSSWSIRHLSYPKKIVNQDQKSINI